MVQPRFKMDENLYKSWLQATPTNRKPTALGAAPLYARAKDKDINQKTLMRSILILIRRQPGQIDILCDIQNNLKPWKSEFKGGLMRINIGELV